MKRSRGTGRAEGGGRTRAVALRARDTGQMPYLTEEVPILEPHRPHDLADHVQLCHGVSGNGRVREKVPVAVVRAMPRKPRSRSVPGTTHAAGREGVRSRVRASVLERRRARGRGAVCAPGAPRPRNRVDDRSRQFEFSFSPAMMLKRNPRYFNHFLDIFARFCQCKIPGFRCFFRKKSIDERALSSPRGTSWGGRGGGGGSTGQLPRRYPPNLSAKAGRYHPQTRGAPSRSWRG